MLTLSNIDIDPFGLNNTGSICYFNSLLQVLAGCTSLYNIIYEDKNNTEKVFHKFIDQLKNNKVNPFISSELIQALNKDVPTFGNGQESASEAFVLLINTINNKKLTETFMYRFRNNMQCLTCGHTTSEKKDHSIVFNIFHTDSLCVKNMLYMYEKLNDYKCDVCNNTEVIRISKLTMLPEIIFASFNIYYNKKEHSFDKILHFEKSKLQYMAIGQIEHFGSLSGGHYTSRSIRQDKTYLFNDSSYYESKLGPTPNTYIVVYHCIKNN